VQNLLPLDRWSPRPVNGQLTVTIGKFYRITGESTQLRGVEPDLALPSAIDIDEVGESALPAALPWDRIAGVPFHVDNRSGPPLATLEVDENARAQKDPDYRWLVSDIAAIESIRKEKSVSLNLKLRREERALQEKDQIERDNARRVAKGLPTIKAAAEEDTSTAPDIVLEQAAEVMGDVITGARPAAPLPATPAPKRQIVKAGAVPATSATGS
jgi:carboxyl-terminal processing protease